MIKVLNILLLILSLVLGFFLIRGIMDPIKFQKQVSIREDQVHAKLLKIRDAQEAYRSVNNTFAPTFDTLLYVLKNKDYVSVNRFSGDTIRVSIADSLFQGNKDEIDDLVFVPFSNAKKFDMDAGVLPSPSDSTLFVPVFEASTYTDDFLQGVNEGFWEKGKKVKVGSMTAPITSGNWE